MAPPFINTRQGDQRLDRARRLVMRQMQQRRMQSQAQRMGPGGVSNMARNLRQRARPAAARVAGLGRASGPLGLAHGRGANFQFTDVGFDFPGNPNPPGLGGAGNPGAEQAAQAWENAQAPLDKGMGSFGAFMPAGGLNLGQSHPALSQDVRRQIMGSVQGTLQSPANMQELLGGGGEQTAFQGGALGNPNLQPGPQPGVSSSLIPVGGGIYFNPATGQYQGMPGTLAMM